MKRTRADVVFDFFNISLMIVIIAIMLFPLYFTIIASLSDPSEVALGKVTILPKGLTLDAYSNVFHSSEVWGGYRNTFFYTVFGTALNLAVTLPCSYVMSKKKLHGRNFFAWFFLITMFFSGGLIPLYLLVKDIHLQNKPYTLIVLGGFAVYYMIVARIFYQTSIPEELYESARIDGSSDYGQFFKIALPLSAPIIAVIGLFYAVGRWNDYFTSLIFISDSKYYPLQLVLRNVLIAGQSILDTIQSNSVKITDEEILAVTRRAYMAEAMKYSLVFIASVPLLIAYPFVQKYFVKGVMVGSLKG